MIDCDDPNCCESTVCITDPNCMVDIPDPTELAQSNDTATQAFDESIEFIFKNSSIQINVNETALDRE